jgi:hypothetical protein
MQTRQIRRRQTRRNSTLIVSVCSEIEIEVEKKRESSPLLGKAEVGDLAPEAAVDPAKGGGLWLQALFPF